MLHALEGLLLSARVRVGRTGGRLVNHVRGHPNLPPRQIAVRQRLRLRLLPGPPGHGLSIHQAVRCDPDRPGVIAVGPCLAFAGQKIVFRLAQPSGGPTVGHATIMVFVNDQR